MKAIKRSYNDNIRLSKLKDDVNSKFANYLPLTGGTLSGQLKIDIGAYGYGAVCHFDRSTELRNNEEDGSHTALLLMNSKDVNGKRLLYRHTSADNNHTYYIVYSTQNLTCGTSDLTAGSSSLATNNIYLVYS